MTVLLCLELLKLHWRLKKKNSTTEHKEIMKIKYQQQQQRFQCDLPRKYYQQHSETTTTTKKREKKEGKYRDNRVI